MQRQVRSWACGYAVLKEEPGLQFALQQWIDAVSKMLSFGVRVPEG